MAVFAYLMFISSAMAQTPRPNSLESLRTAYSNSLARISAESQRQKQAAAIQYGQTLENSLKGLKQKGDIATYSAIQQEQKRFQTEKTVLTNDFIFHVADAVATYQKQLAIADSDFAQRHLALLKKYGLVLNGLIKDLMVRDKIDEARAAGEAQRESEMLVAELESQMQKPTDPPAALTPVQELEPPATLEATPVQKVNIAGKKPVPADASAFNGHHYKLLSDAADWSKAQFKCRAMDGHLAAIERIEENAFIQGLLGEHEGVWIGAESSFSSWRWVTSATSFAYQHWAPGHPVNKTPGKKLGSGIKAAMNKEGFWFSQSGDDSTGISAYICEWDY